MTDADLQRFVTAQDLVIGQVEAELAAGEKRTHWMWFVFPQLIGLGSSPNAQRFAIADLDQARRYLADPVLGERLRRHVRALLRHQGMPIGEILGKPDDLKFRSCLTLFRAASTAPDDTRLFDAGLRQFYQGTPDSGTLERLPAP